MPEGARTDHCKWKQFSVLQVWGIVANLWSALQHQRLALWLCKKGTSLRTLPTSPSLNSASKGNGCYRSFICSFRLQESLPWSFTADKFWTILPDCVLVLKKLNHICLWILRSNFRKWLPQGAELYPKARGRFVRTFSFLLCNIFGRCVQHSNGMLIRDVHCTLFKVLLAMDSFSRFWSQWSKLITGVIRKLSSRAGHCVRLQCKCRKVKCGDVWQQFADQPSDIHCCSPAVPWNWEIRQDFFIDDSIGGLFQSTEQSRALGIWSLCITTMSS